MKRKYIHFLPPYLEFCDHSMHFNRLNHAVKEHALIASAHGLTVINRRLIVVLLGFAKYSILSNCTSLKQQLRYYRRRYISHTPNDNPSAVNVILVTHNLSGINLLLLLYIFHYFYFYFLDKKI